MQFWKPGILEPGRFAGISTGSAKPDALHQHHVEALACEVVARLAQRRPAPDLPADPGADALPDADELETFCEALLRGDEHESAAMIAAAQARGLSLETVYTGYVAAAAARLGGQWEAGLIGCLEMMAVAGRLYAIMRSLRPAAPVAGPGAVRRAIFASVPGDVHFLGVTMAADMFRQRGWQVDLLTGLDHDALLQRINRADVPVIGLSAGPEALLMPLARLVMALRISRPEALIVLGGRITGQRPDLAQLIDADHIAGDAISAIAPVTALLQARASAA